ncbi:hypothetical protein GQ55_5G184200 [Panicum hallii var. hallii]|uniref:Uncharacterized protein n=1 Tax=Panicum hallii var. hallii TaxID=1504633 RepID=A0A2T7DHQ2_9POAL|nr:hypothetical protein GQ55_5G184200 [Panicum hallii var. hallii]
MGLAQIFQEIHPTPTTKANPFRPSHPSPTQQAVKASKRSFPPVLTRFASFHQRRPAPHLGPTPPATWRSPASPSLLLRLAFSSVPPPPPPLPLRLRLAPPLHTSRYRIEIAGPPAAKLWQNGSSCRWLGTPVLLTLISLHDLGCCNIFAGFFVKQFILEKMENNSCVPN